LEIILTICGNIAIFIDIERKLIKVSIID
jgi:hypothetical protein